MPYDLTQRFLLDAVMIENQRASPIQHEGKAVQQL
jgi:hypothetical protein